ncbi:MAG: sulfatase-like hydrolase/transferase [Prevotellaceae bacterium]|nr:sulfatase-like hydrolase/transferase [Prevotellaceae bacterium]
MKKTLIKLVATYFLFLGLFLVQKLFFLVLYRSSFPSLTFADTIAVLWNGLPLDRSAAGYLTAIPGLFFMFALWLQPYIARPLLKIYFLLAALLLAVIFVTDLALYRYWGFRLDSTPLFYFVSSPKDALASVAWWMSALGGLTILCLSVLIYKLFVCTVVRRERDVRPLRNRGKISLVMLLLTGLLFIPIRGGFGVSTMNIGKAYYSHEMFLNHAAVNPAFSLLASLMREHDFSAQYRYMPDEEAERLFASMTEVSAPDSIQTQLLTTRRPNIIFVILESFLSKAMTTLGGLPNVAVNMDSLARDGVLFSRFYANSFRTDRGLVSILSGYPAQPTTSIMKYPRKSQSLPAIPRTLRDAGYTVDYYYGGDADFTNMRSYLLAAGVENIVSEVDFPYAERLSKWGAHDHVVFNRVLRDLTDQTADTPFLKIIQTSSSHEPFEVPFHRLEDPFLNSIAYTDSCLGVFVSQLKAAGQWENTLLVLTPDHAGRFPSTQADLSFARYEIPLIFTGGAVAGSDTLINTIGSQIDIAATLLAQLGLPYDDFRFSKNMLNPTSPHFAYFTFPNAFGYLTEAGSVIYDCDAERIIETENSNKSDTLLAQGQAYLQILFDDLAAR